MMTAALTIESLGLTKEDITERVVQKIADELLRDYRVEINEDGEEVKERYSTPLLSRLEKLVIDRVETAIREIAGRNVFPNIESMIEAVTFQATNEWGEKRGDKLTFTELLVKRAETYLTEQVDHNGHSRAEERNGCGWSAKQTRIAYMIHRHLQYSIETAMKQALVDANGHIVKGIEETVKMKLDEVRQALKIKVETR